MSTVEGTDGDPDTQKEQVLLVDENVNKEESPSRVPVIVEDLETAKDEKHAENYIENNASSNNSEENHKIMISTEAVHASVLESEFEDLSRQIASLEDVIPPSADIINPETPYMDEKLQSKAMETMTESIKSVLNSQISLIQQDALDRTAEQPNEKMATQIIAEIPDNVANISATSATIESNATVPEKREEIAQETKSVHSTIPTMPYLVSKNDRLASVALKFEMTVPELLALNTGKVSSYSQLQAGQVIIVRRPASVTGDMGGYNASIYGHALPSTDSNSQKYSILHDLLHVNFGDMKDDRKMEISANIHVGQDTTVDGVLKLTPMSFIFSPNPWNKWVRKNGEESCMIDADIVLVSSATEIEEKSSMSGYKSLLFSIRTSSTTSRTISMELEEKNVKPLLENIKTWSTERRKLSGVVETAMTKCFLRVGVTSKSPLETNSSNSASPAFNRKLSNPDHPELAAKKDAIVGTAWKDPGKGKESGAKFKEVDVKSKDAEMKSKEFPSRSRDGSFMLKEEVPKMKDDKPRGKEESFKQKEQGSKAKDAVPDWAITPSPVPEESTASSDKTSLRASDFEIILPQDPITPSISGELPGLSQDGTLSDRQKTDSAASRGDKSPGSFRKVKDWVMLGRYALHPSGQQDGSQRPVSPRSPRSPRGGGPGDSGYGEDGPSESGRYIEPDAGAKLISSGMDVPVVRGHTTLEEATDFERFQNTVPTQPVSADALDYEGHASRTLKQSDVPFLREHFPLRYKNSPLVLLYSTQLHGFALRTLYDKCAKEDGCLVMVEDSKHCRFGVFCTDKLGVLSTWVGSGKMFLCSLHPEHIVYNWKGNNEYCIYSEDEGIRFGGGQSGHVGLWLDGDLLQGASGECETFENKCLANAETFRILCVEAWGFRGSYA